MNNPHTKKLLGDHMSIFFKSRPVELDEAVKEMNNLYQIGDILDDMPSEDINETTQRIHQIIFGSTKENS